MFSRKLRKRLSIYGIVLVAAVLLTFIFHIYYTNSPQNIVASNFQEQKSIGWDSMPSEGLNDIYGGFNKFILQLNEETISLNELKTLYPPILGKLVVNDSTSLSNATSSILKQPTTTSALSGIKGIVSHVDKSGGMNYQKIVCLQRGILDIYFYHVRKAAGTSARYILDRYAEMKKIQYYETEGITLREKFLSVQSIFTVIVLRHPIERIISMYWYEHVGWWEGIIHDLEKCKSLRVWIDSWRDGSNWKTKFMSKNPGSVYVEIENYYVKILTGTMASQLIKLIFYF